MQGMYIILPAIAFGALLLAFAGRGSGIRQSFIYAAAAYTLCLVAATELLSVWSLLQLPALAGVWAGVAALAGLYFGFYGERKVALAALRGAWAQFREAWAILSALGLILAVILLLGLVAPPNNWDAMTYRMARVAMWAQEGNVSHFATAYLPQLFHPPLTEWNVLNFQIMTGGDRFANTVQWFALAGCGVAASLIARELKQTFTVQVLAAVVAVTLPMGVLQGSNVLTDLVVSFWLLVFALLAVQYIRAPAAGRLLLCGLALGFALLSKGTAYPIAPPLAAALFLYAVLQSRGAGYRPYVRLAAVAVAVVAVALALNSGHYARNLDLFEHPLSPGGSVNSHVNEEFNLSVVQSNLVRNSVMHLGVPNSRINDLTLYAVQLVFGRVIDDVPGATLGDGIFEAGISFRTQEGFTGNFLHFWFLTAALLGVLLFRKRLRCDGLTVCMALAVVLAALSFCALLQWERWNTRYHTPLFMLGAPVVAAFVASLAARVRLPGSIVPPSPKFRRSNWLLNRASTTGGRIGIVAGVFLITSVWWVIGNEGRPIYAGGSPTIFPIDRTEMYFSGRQGLFQSYVDAVDYLTAYHPKEVGLYMQENDYDYPALALLKEHLPEMSQLAHVGVTNVSGELQDNGFKPPFIFSRKGSLEALAGESYRVVQRLPRVTIMAKTDVVGEMPKGTVSDQIDEMIERGEPIIRSNYDVYISKNRLLYTKDSCSQSDISAYFFLHVVPVDENDLPAPRRRNGFDNYDFRNQVWQDGKKCYALGQLPEYPISSIRTGQYVPGEGETWRGEYHPQ